MKSADDIDQLFAAARASETYIDDAGFTAAVMARLPSRKALPFWKEASITLLFTLIGCLFAFHFFPAEKLIDSLLTGFVITPLSVAGLAMLFTLASGAAYWAAEADRL